MADKTIWGKGDDEVFYSLACCRIHFYSDFFQFLTSPVSRYLQNLGIGFLNIYFMTCWGCHFIFCIEWNNLKWSPALVKMRLVQIQLCLFLVKLCWFEITENKRKRDWEWPFKSASLSRFGLNSNWQRWYLFKR